MDDINEIISSLSDDDIEMLKGVASSILGEKSDNESKPKPQKNNNALSGLNLSQNDLNFMLKAKAVIEKMNTASSKDTELIAALKPHLGAEGRDKADKAIRILRLFEILPYLKDLF